MSQIADFSKPSPLSDVVLLVEEKPLHVNREFLASLSPVFHKMLLGEFTESKQKEVNIIEINYDEFLELLKVIHPPHEEIKAETCESLLKLGDFYQIDLVMKHCDKFLSRQYSDTPTKLLWADKYKLPETKKYILPGTTIISDGLAAYKRIGEIGAIKELKLPEGYIYLTVKHSDTFIDLETGTTTNHVESEWQKFKMENKKLYGTQRTAFESYFSENCWRTIFSGADAMYNLWSQIASLENYKVGV